MHLEPNQIHIWRLDPPNPQTLPHHHALLNAEEKARAAHFRFSRLTESFTSDHGQLRQILSAYIQTAPEQLVFATNPYGKPSLRGIHFNLSHTEGLSVVAITLDAEIGIDVEAIRPMKDIETIAESHFSPQETAALQKAAEKTQAFFRCWTRKEAILKATGQGLSLALDSFTVSLEPQAALLDCNWPHGKAREWSLTNLDFGSNFAGAVAIRHHGSQIIYKNATTPLL